MVKNKPLPRLLAGKVRKRRQRGRKLGFPTANLNLHQTVADGVYFSYAILKKVTYPALTFVGAAQTFAEKKRFIETYILDFNKNIYGQWLTVILLKKIRNNKKFKNKQTLLAAMQNDRKKARKFFKK